MSTSKILSTALGMVPQLGFRGALLSSVRSHGYSDAALSLFPRAEYDLVQYHLDTQKAKLDGIDLTGAHSTNDKLFELLKARLQGNEEALKSQLSEYLQLLKTHPADSLASLHDLSDEVWFLAGDKSNDIDWYTKRASISAVFASAELYQSVNPKGVTKYLQRRLQELETMHNVTSNVSEWLAFNTRASFNVLKSLTR